LFTRTLCIITYMSRKIVFRFLLYIYVILILLFMFIIRCACVASDKYYMRTYIGYIHACACVLQAAVICTDWERRRAWLEMCMEMGFPLPWDFPWEYAEIGTGSGKSSCNNGNGNGYFFRCTKVPIGRLDANAIQLHVVTSHLFFVNNIILSAYFAFWTFCILIIQR